MEIDTTYLIALAILTAIFAALVVLRSQVSPITIFFIALPIPVSVVGESIEGNVSFSDMIIAVAFLLLAFGGKPKFGGAGVAVAIYLLVAGLSSTLSSTASDTLLGIGRMTLVTLVPLLVFANLADPVARLRQGMIGYCIATAGLACCTLIIFATRGIDACMYTFDINKNALGAFYGTAVVIVVAGLATKSATVVGSSLRLIAAYGILGLCGIGSLLVLSRGAWVGTAAGLLVVMGLTGRARPAMIGAILFTPLLMGLWSLLPEERQEYASNISTDSYVMRARFDSMQTVMNAFEANPMFGAGIGLRRTVEPHNVFVQALGETGIMGTAAFVFMIVTAASTLWGALNQLKRTDPNKAVIIAATAVFVVFHVHTLIDVYWRRGIGALSWVCVGTAVAVLRANARCRPAPAATRPLGRFRHRAVRVHG